MPFQMKVCGGLTRQTTRPIVTIAPGSFLPVSLPHAAPGENSIREANHSIPGQHRFPRLHLQSLFRLRLEPGATTVNLLYIDQNNTDDNVLPALTIRLI
jgi:hypothetical protein